MAKKVPQLKIWQNGSGTWSVGYIDSFSKDMDNFMIPCRAMNMPPAQFIPYILDKYPGSHVYGRLDGTFFTFYWDETHQVSANKYKNDMNKIIRQNCFMI